MKICRKCNIEKNINEFSSYKRKEFIYYKSYCKKCSNKIKDIKRKVNRLKESDREKNIRYKRKYGISLQDYYNIYEDQQGLCKICGKFNDKLVVDHCHESKVVRGLLCDACNKVLGFARDNSNILGRAILYLKQTNTDKF